MVLFENEPGVVLYACNLSLCAAEKEASLGYVDKDTPSQKKIKGRESLSLGLMVALRP